ncbi:TlpA family protein disulfide reductase, partial [Desulfovibrio sp. OttesenSCG-928-M16]|nr:TlpA family protein disulfide reductase [Desulfovibrio sp. OttesenSCG-928-M16]
AALFALLLMICLGAVGAPGAAQINPGDIASIDAGELLKQVSQEKGKIFIVNVFASWCPPCRDEIPGLVNVRRAFTEDQVKLLGVSVDKEPKALAAYMKELHINYPVKLAKGDFIQRVGVTAVPQLLIYNKQGELVINHRGLVDEADLKSAITEILAE